MNIMKVSDSKLLHGLYQNAIFEDHRDMPTERRSSFLAMTQLWADPDSAAETLMAVTEGRALGFAVVSTGPRYLARRLLWLYVFEDYRGKGAGAALVREVLARYRNVQVACDAALVPFYKAQGFPIWATAVGQNRGSDMVGYATKKARRDYLAMTPAPELMAWAMQADADMW